MTGLRTHASTVFICLTGALAVPSSAMALATYASPTGSGIECSEQNPCEIGQARQTALAQNADEVIVLPGTYTLGTTVAAGQGIDLHGQAGAPRPVLVSTAGTALATFDSATVVSDLEVVHSGSLVGLDANDATIERVLVQSNSGIACSITDFSMIRDSLCRETSAGDAILLSGGGASGNSAELRNVTAFATGGASAVGIRIFTGANAAIDARNVIAQGGDFDARASNIGGFGGADIMFESSNYDTRSAVGFGSSVTAAGTGTNQTAPPLFADAANGDLHQLAGSPTIDAGTVDALLGTADFDRDARIVGAAPDIGADEFVPAAPGDTPPPEVDTSPPDTLITKEPKGRTTHPVAIFRFESNEEIVSFQCKLDKRPWRLCESPRRYRRVDEGRHGFKVRAVDAAGNVDPTPDRDRWRVLDRA